MRLHDGTASIVAAPDRHALALFAAVSALLHLLLLFLPLPEWGSRSGPALLMPVELLPPPRAAKRQEPEPERQQIVSPSDLAEEREPDRPTRFLSDKNSRVAKETVKRGMPSGGGAKSRVLQPLASGRQTRPAAEKPPSRLAFNDLFRSPGELMLSRERRKQVARPAPETEPKRKRKIELALGGIGSLSSSTGGVPDYLPDIRPGQFTLLNAKANLFAPFVRRVGLRVFEHLLIGERRLEPRELLAAQGQAVIRAVLGADGKLVDLRTEKVSGSQGLDRTLRRACRLGAFDNNPPRGAQRPDGTYEFVFEARLRPWSADGARVGRVDSFLSIRLL